MVAVVTRDQKKREELADLERVRQEKESAARPGPAEEDEWPFTGLDDTLFQASRNRSHQTWKQKRAERQRCAEAMRDELDHPFNITRKELKELQGDKSLRSAREQAHTVSLGEGNMFLCAKAFFTIGGPQQCRY